LAACKANFDKRSPTCNICYGRAGISQLSMQN